jgi:hypothetical protein
MFRSRKEPSAEAGAEQLMKAVDKRLHAARKNPAKLAGERQRFLRGFVGPIADHFGGCILEAASVEIETNPNQLDFRQKYLEQARQTDSAPSVLHAADTAALTLGKVASAYVDNNLRPHPTFQRASQSVLKAGATFEDHFNHTIYEGVGTGLVFPLNFATTYMYQSFGAQDWRHMRYYTPDQYIETMRSDGFRQALGVALMPANGVWKDYSGAVQLSPFELASPRILKNMVSSETGQVSSAFKQDIIDHRRRTNVLALHMASTNGENKLRLGAGCPVARPHTGTRNLFERASAATLTELGVDHRGVQAAMAGTSIRSGLALGETVCRIVRDNGFTLPTLTEVNDWSLANGRPLVYEPEDILEELAYMPS